MGTCGKDFRGSISTTTQRKSYKKVFSHFSKDLTEQPKLESMLSQLTKLDDLIFLWNKTIVAQLKEVEKLKQ